MSSFSGYFGRMALSVAGGYGISLDRVRVSKGFIILLHCLSTLASKSRATFCRQCGRDSRSSNHVQSENLYTSVRAARRDQDQNDRNIFQAKMAEKLTRTLIYIYITDVQ